MYEYLSTHNSYTTSDFDHFIGLVLFNLGSTKSFIKYRPVVS